MPPTSTSSSDQREDREEQEAQQEVDALDAAVDHPVEAAGLAGDVVAQAQRMDVPEGLEREPPQRPLADPGEDPVAQLGEARRRRAASRP